MKPLTLVLSTPEGVPPRLLDLWDRRLFSTIRVQEYGFETDSVEEQVKTLHEKILLDHQKTWFQLCRDGFKLDDKAYQEPLKAIIQTILKDSESDTAVVDPLLCFLSPLWIQHIDRCHCLFCYSEPMEAAVNLQSKWRFPISFGLALWEYYVVSALRQMQDGSYTLFSIPQFREEPESYMREIQRRLRLMRGNPAENDEQFGILLKSEWNISVAIPERTRYMNQSQIDLFEGIESGDLENMGTLSISDQSADILFQYGNIRAGYDQLKQEKETIENELKLYRTRNTETSTSATTEPLAGSSGSLVEVVVHIEGMAPLDFLVEEDNPIVDTLNNTLLTQSQSPNELVYLHYGESEDAAIYFPAQDLLAVETNRQQQ